MLCPSVGHCTGVLLVRMRRRLCFTAASARSSLMQARLRVGDGATEDPASSHRREEATRTTGGSAHSSRRVCACCVHVNVCL